jgi:hypothetical protein
MGHRNLSYFQRVAMQQLTANNIMIIDYPLYVQRGDQGQDLGSRGPDLGCSAYQSLIRKSKSLGRAGRRSSRSIIPRTSTEWSLDVILSIWCASQIPRLETRQVLMGGNMGDLVDGWCGASLMTYWLQRSADTVVLKHPPYDPGTRRRLLFVSRE